jgi:hypothetical protein
LDDLFPGIKHITNEHRIILEKYQNLIHLSLNNLGLESFQNFPNIPSLGVVIKTCLY